MYRYYGHLDNRVLDDQRISFDFNIACMNPADHAIKEELYIYVVSKMQTGGGNDEEEVHDEF